MSNAFVAVCPIKECNQQAAYKQSKNPKVYSFGGIRHGHRGFMTKDELKELVVTGIIEPQKQVELEEGSNGARNHQEGWEDIFADARRVSSESEVEL